MSSENRKSMPQALGEGLYKGLLAILRAAVSVYAVYLVIKLGAEPAVNLVAATWMNNWQGIWSGGVTFITVVLCATGASDGLRRDPLPGIRGVPVAFLQKLGTTIVGLIGGALALGTVKLLLYALFVVALGREWNAISMDPMLKFIVRLAAPVAFFLGTLFAATVALKRLASLDRPARTIIIAAWILFALLPLSQPTQAQAAGRPLAPLSQQTFLTNYARLSQAVQDADAAGNPIILREQNARFKAFLDTTLTNGRPVVGWAGRLDDMQLDEDGAVMYCNVTLGLGGLPGILVTNFDEATGDTTRGAMAEYRKLKAGDAVRFTGSIRNPVRGRNMLKVIPGGEGWLGSLARWGVVATSITKRETGAEATRLLRAVDAVPALAESIRAIAEQCEAVAQEVYHRSDGHPPDTWRRQAATNPAIGEAYLRLVGRRLPPEQPNSFDPFDYVAEPQLSRALRVEPIEVDGSRFDRVEDFASQARLEISISGDLPPSTKTHANLMGEMRAIGQELKAHLQRRADLYTILGAIDAVHNEGKVDPWEDRRAALPPQDKPAARSEPESSQEEVDAEGVDAPSPPSQPPSVAPSQPTGSRSRVLLAFVAGRGRAHRENCKIVGVNIAKRLKKQGLSLIISDTSIRRATAGQLPPSVAEEAQRFNAAYAAVLELTYSNVFVGQLTVFESNGQALDRETKQGNLSATSVVGRLSDFLAETVKQAR